MLTQIAAQCPHCGAQLKATAAQAGKRVRCPACKQPFEVSAQASAAPAPKTTPAAATETHSLAGAGTSAATLDSSPGFSSSQAPRGQLGRFALRQLLGQGAFGRVYRAHDPQLDRFVALKVPTFDPQDNDKIQRFLAEAKAAARLRHPNIVPTYESGQAGGQYFIASEFISGQPLSKRIKESPPDFRQAAEWTRQLAGALAYAHDEGVIHRDVKPDNILLDEKGVPQITDFGLAKRINEDSGMTTDGAILGTPAYMAPEQARGDVLRVGAASDQYSLGVVLYELLTLKRPFEGPPHAVIAQVMNEEPPAPRSLRPEIPRDLEAICQKAMSKHPAARYASIAELANDLNRWLCGEPTAARPLSGLERGLRWCRRRPVSIALTATAFIAGVAAIAAVAMLPAPHSPQVAGLHDPPPGLPPPRLPDSGTPPPQPEPTPTPTPPADPPGRETKSDEGAAGKEPLPPPPPPELSAAEKEDVRYRAQLASAVALFHQGAPHKAADELGKLAPPEPAWEWRYWMALWSKEPVMRAARAEATPRWLRFSRDGQFLLVGSSARDEKNRGPWNAIYFPDGDRWAEWPKDAPPGGRVGAFSEDNNQVLTITNTPSRNEAVPRLWAWDHRNSIKKIGESEHLVGYALDCGNRDGHWLVLTAAVEDAASDQSAKWELKPPLVRHKFVSSTEDQKIELIRDDFYAACFSSDMSAVHVLVHRAAGTFWESFDAGTGEKKESRQIGPPLAARQQWVKDDDEQLNNWRVTHSTNTAFTGGKLESPGALVVLGGAPAIDFSPVIGNIAAAFEPDGKRLLLVSGDNARLHLFDPAGPQPLESFPPILLQGAPSATAPLSIELAQPTPTSMSHRLAVALDNTITIIDVPAAH